MNEIELFDDIMIKQSQNVKVVRNRYIIIDTNVCRMELLIDILLPYDTLKVFFSRRNLSANGLSLTILLLF